MSRFHLGFRNICRFKNRVFALRELEASGLVNRIVYAEVPPRVEYELTEEGKSLKPVLKSLKKWGEEHAMDLISAREQVGE